MYERIPRMMYLKCNVYDVMMMS